MREQGGRKENGYISHTLTHTCIHDVQYMYMYCTHVQYMYVYTPSIIYTVSVQACTNSVSHISYIHVCDRV